MHCALIFVSFKVSKPPLKLGSQSASTKTELRQAATYIRFDHSDRMATHSFVHRLGKHDAISL